LSQNIKFNGSFAGKYFGPKIFDMLYCTQNEAESIYFSSLTHNKKINPRRTQSARSEFFLPTIYHSSTISEKKFLLYVRSPWACLECVYAKKKGGVISHAWVPLRVVFSSKFFP